MKSVSVENQRLASILGALLIGVWLPLRIVGFELPYGLNLVFAGLVPLFSLNNVLLYFRESAADVRSWREWFGLGLFVDFALVVPWALMFYLHQGSVPVIVYVLNLAIVRHANQIRKFLDRFDGLSPVVFRLIPVFVTLPLLVHTVACGWIALGEGNAEPATDLVVRYVRSWYWAMTTLTTVGYGDIVPKSVPQMIYAGCVQLAGVGVFGFIVSNVATLLHRSDAAREHHMDSVDRLETFMKMHSISPSLRSNVRHYFHYLWTHKRGYQERSVLQELPSKIQSELFFEINRSIVSKVDFLKGASSDLLEELMLSLEPRIFVPGEKIFRIDEPGHAIYFIHSGLIEIRGRDNSLIATLSDGQFFGEMALLSDRPRAASARAASYCEVYVLGKEAFHRAMMVDPAFRAHVETIAKSRQL